MVYAAAAAAAAAGDHAEADTHLFDQSAAVLTHVDPC
jgi:hypothetical protein